MITSIYSSGLCSRTVLPITGWSRHSRGTGHRKLLAAAPGGSWLPLEGLPFLPTSLEVQISFGDDLGVICSTVSKLLNQILIRPQTPVKRPVHRWARVPSGNQEDRSPSPCEPGRGARGGSFNAESTQFLPRRLGMGGTPGALIQPRSPQFGDSAAAEIW